MLLSSFVAGDESKQEGTSEALPISDDLTLDERFAVATFSVFVAICISLAGVLICYFFAMEDSLMRLYQAEGEVVHGRVLEAQRFPCVGAEPEPEYKALVDYKYLEIGGYTTMIRKEMHICNSNLRCSNDQDEKQHSRQRVIIHIDLQDFERELDTQLSDEESAVAIYDPKELEVVVLPNYPKSGLPKYHIDRSFTFVKRRPTYALVCSIFATSFFCIFWGTSTINPDYGTSPLTNISVSIIINVTLWIIDAILIHSFFRTFLHKALAEEYLIGGDSMVKMDDETLATLSSRSMSSKEYNSLHDLEAMETS